MLEATVKHPQAMEKLQPYVIDLHGKYPFSEKIFSDNIAMCIACVSPVRLRLLKRRAAESKMRMELIDGIHVTVTTSSVDAMKSALDNLATAWKCMAEVETNLDKASVKYNVDADAARSCFDTCLQKIVGLYLKRMKNAAKSVNGAIPKGWLTTVKSKNVVNMRKILFGANFNPISVQTGIVRNAYTHLVGEPLKLIATCVNDDSKDNQALLAELKAVSADVRTCSTYVASVQALNYALNKWRTATDAERTTDDEVLALS